MLKVLFLTDCLTGGGAEKVLRNLVNQMDQERFEITVQTVEKENPEKLLVPGIRYKAMNSAKSALGKKLRNYWLRLCGALKIIYPLYIQDGYDIEIAWLECGATKFLAGNPKPAVLRLAWIHCDLEKKEGMAPRRDWLKRIYNAYDNVVCVSQNVSDSMKSWLGVNNTKVLYNVNDLRDIREQGKAFSVKRENCLTMVAVGRLCYQKGYDRSLEACSLLKDAGVAFRLWILGQGSDRALLEEKRRKLDLEKQISFLEFQENPYPYMVAADMTVCASRYEGFSTVLTESMILGTPVITMACTGMEELLGQGEYGVITEPTPEALAKGIRALWQSPELYSHYRNKAIERAEQLDGHHALQKIQTFLQQALEQKIGKQEVEC